MFPEKKLRWPTSGPSLELPNGHSFGKKLTQRLEFLWQETWIRYVGSCRKWLSPSEKIDKAKCPGCMCVEILHKPDISLQETYIAPMSKDGSVC